MTLFAYVASFIMMVQPGPSKAELESQLSRADSVERVRLLNQLFELYVNNNPIQGLTYTQEALLLADSLGYQKGVADAYNNMGVFYVNRGNLERALGYFLNALDTYRTIDYEEGIANALANIGTVYSRQGDLARALRNFEAADTIYQKSQQPKYIIGSLTNIGNIYNDQGNVTRALEYYRKALPLFESLEDKRMAFNPLANMGSAFMKTGNHDSALAYFRRALVIEQQSDNRHGQADVLLRMGEAYLILGDRNQGVELLLEAQSVAQQIDDKPLLEQIYERLSEAYFASNDLQVAYFYLKLASSLKDSLYSLESNRAITEMESAYQLEEQERENNLLRQNNQIFSLELSNRRNQEIIVSLGLIVALGVVAVLVYLVFQNKRRQALLREKHDAMVLYNQEISQKNQEIEEKSSDLVDSLYYARSIQDSIIERTGFSGNLPHSFVYDKPKDIVSGDFFWYSRNGDVDVVAVVDCTGHGVAGAFMTVVANSLLHQIIHEDNVLSPAEVLLQLEEKMKAHLKQQELDHTSHGMDVAIINVVYSTGALTFAGAKRSLYYVEGGQLHEIRGNKASIGESYTNLKKVFSEHTIKFDESMTFYLMSDGYADQFGGPKNKKYLTKRLKKNLEDMFRYPMDYQRELLEKNMDEWMQGQDQTDDMLVVGFRLIKTEHTIEELSVESE